MTKTDLISLVSQKADISKSKADVVVNAILDGIENSLKKGDKVSLIGFGTFSVSKRAARIGRNPKTGKEIKIAATKVPKFKAGKSLKDAVKKK